MLTYCHQLAIMSSMKTANRKHLAAAQERVRSLGRQYVIREALDAARFMRLGARIKAVRESLGETQVEFAEGISRSANFPFSVWALRSLEQGEQRDYIDPRWSTIQIIAQYLGVGTDEFLNLSELG
jgi:DNA-binding XRE family transcriptional regulator